MHDELISAITRLKFREYFVSTTLSIITDVFEAANVDLDNRYDPGIGGQRRTLVEQYYHTLDFSDRDDVNKLLSVYEHVLIDLEAEMNASEDVKDAERWHDLLTRLLRRDGFEFVNARIVRMGESAAMSELDDIAGRFSTPVLQSQIDRIRQSIERDPELAIGTSKELVETTCKTILSLRKIDYDVRADIETLVKATRKALELLPEDIPEQARGAKTIKHLLGGLGTVVKGLGEIRNLYGTGHGRHGQSRGLTARHARLAVGAATTLVLFFWETHEVREPKP